MRADQPPIHHLPESNPTAKSCSRGMSVSQTGTMHGLLAGASPKLSTFVWYFARADSEGQGRD